MNWKHFTTLELACRHCGECHMEPEFMERLEKLRHDLDFPFPVNSGYRCPLYNAQISSSGFNGAHTHGRAVDIRISGESAFRLVAVAALYGFTGIGISQTGVHTRRFIHLDDLRGSHPRPRIWSY